jgi:predicted SPOUT superfamily RNA methylase MTH1
MFMCKRHWFMLPKAMRDRVWEHYVPGQEVRKDPTEEYLFVTLECVNYVARMEGL